MCCSNGSHRLKLVVDKHMIHMVQFCVLVQCTAGHVVKGFSLAVVVVTISYLHCSAVFQ